MEGPEWVTAAAVVVAFFALVVSALSYLETKRTAIASDSMARSSEVSAEAAKASADSAKQSADFQLAANTRQNTAFVRRQAHFTFEYNEKDDQHEACQFVTLGFTVSNYGPAIAADLALAIGRSGASGAIISPPHRFLHPYEETVISIRIDKSFMQDCEVGELEILLFWKDGNGVQSLGFKGVVSGKWGEIWLFAFTWPHEPTVPNLVEMRTLGDYTIGQ